MVTYGVITMWMNKDDDGSPIVVASAGSRFYYLSSENGAVLSHDDGTREQPERDSVPPYHDTDGSDSDDRWEVDGHIGIVIGKTRVSGVDLRRDPENSHLAPGPGPAPRWAGPRKRTQPQDGGSR
jgi:hypothetical protein